MKADDLRIQMINIMDVAKILNVDGFALLKGKEIESFIQIVEDGWATHYGKRFTDAIINIESSTEIYINELVFYKLTCDVFPEIYSWFESKQYLEAASCAQIT